MGKYVFPFAATFMMKQKEYEAGIAPGTAGGYRRIGFVRSVAQQG